MKYITGIHALNLNCSLETCGDWHQSALQWEHPTIWDSETAFYGDYGIEDCSCVPENPGTHKIANHIRAVLDLLAEGNFALAQGMKNELICADQYTQEIFKKIIELKDQPHWEKIKTFMGREYGMEWLHYLEISGIPVKTGTVATPEPLTPESLVRDFLLYLNHESDQFVLKGGAALRLCYQSERFSDNIDLDGRKEDIKGICQRYCKLKGFDMSVDKDTPVVKCCLLHWDEHKKPLKVEASYRYIGLRPEKYPKIHGIKVYCLEDLAVMKALAWGHREKLRDLYDLIFIALNNYDQLSSSAREIILDSLMYKTMEVFYFTLSMEKDPQIDNRRLMENFFKMCDQFGLRMDSLPFCFEVDEKVHL